MTEPITWDRIHAFMSDLRSIGQQLLRFERSAHSLHPTDLVLTALRRQKPVDHDWSEITWKDRNYFFRSVHQAMRRALIDHARKRNAIKRKAIRPVKPPEIRLDDLARTAEEQPEIILALEEALDALAKDNPQWVQLIQHRYFDGLSVEDAARVLEISKDTAKRWWRHARLVLHNEILKIVNRDADHGSPE